MGWMIDYFKYRFGEVKEQREVKRLYYQNPHFSRVDRALLKSYVFGSPYRVSKRYQKKNRIKNIHPYGETPLTTFEEIGKQIDLQPSDRVLELGCGRGRGVFFLHHFFKCEVIGVEQIPQFVRITNQIAKKFQVEGVCFKCSDLFEMEALEVGVVYLFGTTFNEAEIGKVIACLKKCVKGTRIVTISYPLTDYDREGAFYLEKSFTLSFLWGEAEGYLQTVR